MARKSNPRGTKWGKLVSKRGRANIRRRRRQQIRGPGRIETTHRRVRRQPAGKVRDRPHRVAAYKQVPFWLKIATQNEGADEEPKVRGASSISNLFDSLSLSFSSLSLLSVSLAASLSRSAVFVTH